MALKTFVNYYDPVVASRIGEILKALANPVILEGGALSIPFSNTIRIAPFKAMLPSGAVLVSDESYDFTFQLTSIAKDYSLTVDHTYQEISGGVTPKFSIKDNVLPASQVPDSLIVAWLRYPGNSAALDKSQIYEPRRTKIKETSSLVRDDYRVAPLDGITIQSSGSVLDVTTEFSNGYVQTKLINNNPSIGVVKKLYPMVAKDYPPARLFVEARADFQASVTFAIRDKNGVTYQPSNNIIADTAWTKKEMVVPNLSGNAYFGLGELYYVEMTVQLNPGKSVSIASIGVSTYNLPALL
jgi:hypothetical protein